MTIIVITMAILMSVIIIHMSDLNNMSDLRTGFMIRPIISIFGMLIIPSLPHNPTPHLHIIIINIHRSKIVICMCILVLKISHLCFPNVSDPGPCGHPFKDPKDSDILCEAARDGEE